MALQSIYLLDVIFRLSKIYVEENLLQKTTLQKQIKIRGNFVGH